MKKNKLLAIFMLVVSVFIISACSFQKDKNIAFIEIIKETLPETIEVGKFDQAGIKAKVVYDDETSETIDVTSALLGDEYSSYINQAGTYTVEILFRGKTVSFTINMVDPVEVYTVRFYNGNNQLISMQVVENGADAVAPSAALYAMDGYNFIGWDRTFTDVSSDINVYGVYVKVTDGEEVDYSDVLMAASNEYCSGKINIRKVMGDDNISEIREITNIYNDYGVIIKTVEKMSRRNQLENMSSVEYVKYTICETGYTLTPFDEEGEKLSLEVDFEQIKQFDPREIVSKFLQYSSDVSYTLNTSQGKQYYTATLVIPEQYRDYEIAKYEIVFTESELLYTNIYRSFSLDFEFILSESEYYNKDVDQEVIYPTEINLGSLTHDLFDEDVKIDVREMRDGLYEETVYVDGDNNAWVKSNEFNEEGIYYWIGYQGVRYYTKEAFTSNNLPSVYKTNNSSNFDDKYYYNIWKENANSFRTTMTAQGGIIFEAVIEETSQSRGCTIRFEVYKNKLANFSIFVFNELDEATYFKTDIFDYQEVEVNVPKQLISSESNAIEE